MIPFTRQRRECQPMRESVTASIAVVVLCVSMAGARQAPAPQPPRFRSSVDLVRLDVSVLDRDRRPVRGLKPSDFTILEDGTRQDISVFQAVDIPAEPPPRTPWVRTVAPDVRSNAGLHERRLFLIIMDDAMIQASPAAANSARAIARDFIEQLGPSDLAALIFTRDNRHAQDYTSDRGRLLSAAAKFSFGFRDMAPVWVPGADDGYMVFSEDTIANAVETLATMPDRRKVVVYIGQGLPLNIELTGASALTPGLPPEEIGGASALSKGALHSRLRGRLEEIFTDAAAANINIYTFDVCGVRAPPGPLRFPAPTCVPGLEQDFLRDLAEGTGGRAVVDSNDFSEGIQRVFNENASYYLLGFQPARSHDGKMRRLSVRVNRPNVFVRTRSSYRADKPAEREKRAAVLAASPLGVALSGVLPNSDLPLDVVAVPFLMPGWKDATVAIAVGVKQPIRETGARTIEKVDLQVTAFDVNGKRHNSRTMKADVAIRAGATGLAEYEVLSRIELKPGRYQLRLAAHVWSLATSGSIYYDVDVPDFREAPVSISGIVLTAEPSHVVAPRDLLTKVIPVIPTTRRTFAAADRVTAFARVYQGGRATLARVPIRVQLVNENGVVMLDRHQDIGPERFTDERSANLLIDVPVSRLAAGEYLITLETPTGKTVLQRTMRFRVSG